MSAAFAEFIAQLSDATRRALEEEGLDSMELISLVPREELRSLGFRLGDLSKLEKWKRGEMTTAPVAPAAVTTESIAVPTAPSALDTDPTPPPTLSPPQQQQQQRAVPQAPPPVMEDDDDDDEVLPPQSPSTAIVSPITSPTSTTTTTATVILITPNHKIEPIGKPIRSSSPCRSGPPTPPTQPLSYQNSTLFDLINHNNINHNNNNPLHHDDDDTHGNGPRGGSHANEEDDDDPMEKLNSELDMQVKTAAVNDSDDVHDVVAATLSALSAQQEQQQQSSMSHPAQQNKKGSNKKGAPVPPEPAGGGHDESEVSPSSAAATTTTTTKPLAKQGLDVKSKPFNPNKVGQSSSSSSLQAVAQQQQQQFLQQQLMSVNGVAPFNLLGNGNLFYGNGLTQQQQQQPPAFASFMNSNNAMGGNPLLAPQVTPFLPLPNTAFGLGAQQAAFSPLGGGAMLMTGTMGTAAAADNIPTVFFNGNGIPSAKFVPYHDQLLTIPGMLLVDSKQYGDPIILPKNMRHRHDNTMTVVTICQLAPSSNPNHVVAMIQALFQITIAVIHETEACFSVTGIDPSRGDELHAAYPGIWTHVRRDGEDRWCVQLDETLSKMTPVDFQARLAENGLQVASHNLHKRHRIIRVTVPVEDANRLCQRSRSLLQDRDGCFFVATDYQANNILQQYARYLSEPTRRDGLRDALLPCNPVVFELLHRFSGK